MSKNKNDVSEWYITMKWPSFIHETQLPDGFCSVGSFERVADEKTAMEYGVVTLTSDSKLPGGVFSLTTLSLTSKIARTKLLSLLTDGFNKVYNNTSLLTDEEVLYILHSLDSVDETARMVDALYTKSEPFFTREEPSDVEVTTTSIKQLHEINDVGANDTPDLVVPTTVAMEFHENHYHRDRIAVMKHLNSWQEYVTTVDLSVRASSIEGISYTDIRKCLGRFIIGETLLSPYDVITLEKFKEGSQKTK